MKAILLSAGKGTRLYPYTKSTPKCLMKIKSKPLLQIWLENLNKIGIKQFLVNTHYLHNQVEDFIRRSKFYSQVTLSYEKKLLGTGGTLIKNKMFYNNEDGLLIHTDNYCLEDINNLIKAHKKRPKQCIITMMTFKTNKPSLFGIVKINEEKIVTNFYEKVNNPPGNLANCAIYIVSSEFLKMLDKRFININDFSNDVLNKILGKIYTYETKKKFVDIGTEQAYLSVK